MTDIWAGTEPCYMYETNSEITAFYQRHPEVIKLMHICNDNDCQVCARARFNSKDTPDCGLFVKRLESRSLSTWTDIEMIKHAALTGQLCRDCGEIDCICPECPLCGLTREHTHTIE